VTAHSGVNSPVSAHHRVRSQSTATSCVYLV
jgi:hypothetical protein